ncbi:MAG: NAD(+) synthase [Flavobacteriales bacterium]
MNTEGVIEHIVSWLNNYAENAKVNGFVIGVSGGIDSALTSTLCAMTGKETLLLELPIYQAASQVTRAQQHMEWLASKYPNVKTHRVELTPVFDQFMNSVPSADNEALLNLSLANTRSRLRMMTLYYFAGIHKLLVAGTGNKVEDFGVGFYTKYGDGGVDLSPIADLMKTEVYELCKYLGVAQSIQEAKPTDGLWGDDRSDEDQIGASYPELEWAMNYIEENGGGAPDLERAGLSDRQKEVLAIYWRMNRANQHKMNPIPVCTIPNSLK